MFRASFSISIFFLVHTLLSRFVRLPHQRHAFLLLMTVEVPAYAAILIGSFYMPSCACLSTALRVECVCFP